MGVAMEGNASFEHVCSSMSANDTKRTRYFARRDVSQRLLRRRFQTNAKVRESRKKVRNLEIQYPHPGFGYIVVQGLEPEHATR